MNTGERHDSSRRWLTVLLIMAGCKLLIHLSTNAFASYGIFRDEFYYLACSNRLAAGYVDQPPLSIIALALQTRLFGDSLFALRLLPALLGAMNVLVAGLIARRMGGGTYAMIITATAMIVPPIYLGFNTYYSMNSFDLFFWTLAAFLLVRIIQGGRPADWILFGGALGLGLLNKTGMLWFCAGTAAALLLTDLRAHLRTRWPYAAALIALLLFSPFIIWNLRHDWAHLEFIHRASTLKYSGINPADFLAGQLLMLHPLAIWIALAGLISLFATKSGRRFSALGIIFLTTMLILILNRHSKPEYLSASYAPIFAAGAVLLERLPRRRIWRAVRGAIPVLMLAGGAIIAPYALPVLPVETYIRYAERIGINPDNYESKEVAQLHQFYADMFGWETLAATVSKVYTGLPKEERRTTVIFGVNYGNAGALEYYRKRYPLPPVISGHNNYWLWGPGPESTTTVITAGVSREALEGAFAWIEEAAVFHCTYCMPYENNRPVLICRQPALPLADLWDETKHYE